MRTPRGWQATRRIDERKQTQQTNGDESGKRAEARSGGN
jgi:hypothetical protein